MGARRGISGLMVVAALAGVFGGRSASAVPAPIVCQAEGTADVHGGSTRHWTLSLLGSCLWGHKSIPVHAQGSGTSQGCGGVIDKLTLSVTHLIEYEGLPGFSLSFSEVWRAGKTTYPAATPFRVTDNGSVVGAGTLFAHLANACPGNPKARAVWTRTMPDPAPVGAITCTASGSLSIYATDLYNPYAIPYTWDFQGDATCRRRGGGPEVWTGPIAAIGGSDNVGVCNVEPVTSWVPWRVSMNLTETTSGVYVDAYDSWDVVGVGPLGMFVLFEQGILTMDPTKGCDAIPSNETEPADVVWDMSF